MCCVGGMVEETMREAADHGFESNERTRIYFGAFFLGGGAFNIGSGTNSGCGLVLELHFLAVLINNHLQSCGINNSKRAIYISKFNFEDYKF